MAPSDPAAPPASTPFVRVQVPASIVEDFLKRALLFHRCDPAVVAKMAPLFEGLECPAGAEVVSAGVANGGLGILFSGRASVRLADGSIVEMLQVGEHFGETSLLLRTASPYSVVTEEACNVLWLRAEIALNLFGKIPAISDALNRRLATQLSRACALEHTPLSLTEALPSARRGGVALTADMPAGELVVPFVEVTSFDIPQSVLTLVPVKLIRQHRLLPLRLHDQKLTVGMVAPQNVNALAELRATLQAVEIEHVAISADDFNAALVRFRLDPSHGLKSAGKAGAPLTNPESLSFEHIGEEREPAGSAVRAVGDEVIKFVNKLIAAALDSGASDIHIEPTGAAPRVRFRVHGTLQEWSETAPPTVSLKAITARVKVLGGLDITERRLPQDGRIGLSAGKRDVDLRVSTLPANRGEKIVMRVLEASGSTRQLEQIFFEPTTLQAIRRALNRPYGGILVAGPTGSGKTSTLYSILNERKVVRPDTNIIMVEDPIEYRMPGVTQVQANPGVGLGFAQVLRAMLRQDPDVIVVGETRDHDTAVLALEAAMTGHLLLTSLHANNAVATFQRLENLGCTRPLLAQSVALVLVQRLVRKLCTACRTLDVAPAALLESLVARKIIERGALTQLPRAVGCDACNQTGYVGRAAVIESMQINDDVRNALASGAALAEVQKVAQGTQAFMPFAGYAAALMAKQIISPSEVLLSVAE